MPNPKDSRVEDLLGIGESLFQKDHSWFSFAQDICENFYPERADYTETADFTGDYASYVQDGSPINFHEQLASAIPAMLRQGPNWFTVGSGDEALDHKPDIARALKQATRMMRSVIYARGSNWDHATNEGDRDWTSVGQPVLSIEENANRTQHIFRAHHPKSVSWLTDELGRPVALWRKFRETARNVVRGHAEGRYNGTLANELKTAAKDQPNREFPFYQVLIPATDLYAADMKEQKRVGGLFNHRYVNCYIDVSHRTYLSERSMPLMNYIAPAFRRLSTMRRGFSPCTFHSIGDARMLQSMALVILEQGEKAVDPPVIAAGEIFRSEMNLFSGGTTFADLGDRKLQDVMTTIQTSEGVRLGVDLKQDIRNLIAEALLINKLTLPSVREMRELEVAARMDEFRRAALPFFTPIEGEYHTQYLGLLFDMMQARGVFPQGMFPRELAQVEEVKFTFTSPLNEADGRKSVEAFFSAVQILAAGKEVDETVTNLVNMRDATVLALQGAGLPPEVIKTDEEREKADNEAAMKTSLTSAANIGQQGAGVVADLANARLAAAQAAQVGGPAPGGM